MKNDWKGLINNPLGIIGFFLVIVEGIAGFVITQSTLTHDLNKVLVWFIVCFPILVLSSFLVLVIWHHEKLYAPRDFENPDHFIAVLKKDSASGIELKTIKPFGGEEIESKEELDILLNESVEFSSNSIIRVGISQDLPNYMNKLKKLVSTNGEDFNFSIHDVPRSGKIDKSSNSGIWFSIEHDFKKCFDLAISLFETNSEFSSLMIRNNDTDDYGMFIGSINQPFGDYFLLSLTNLTKKEIEKLQHINNYEELKEFSEKR